MVAFFAVLGSIQAANSVFASGTQAHDSFNRVRDDQGANSRKDWHLDLVAAFEIKQQI
jgi:hypothetical protein